jgi:hypothetical protein
MDTLIFNTDFNSIGGFFVNLALGVVAGALLALLSRQWPIRRALRGALRTESGLPLAAFSLPTLLFGAWAYISYLTPFIAAHVSPSAITFEYRFPWRAVTVTRNDVDRIVKGAGEDEAWVNLVVYTKDGRRFESVPIRSDRFEGLRGRLQPASERQRVPGLALTSVHAHPERLPQGIFVVQRIAGIREIGVQLLSSLHPIVFAPEYRCSRVDQAQRFLLGFQPFTKHHDSSLLVGF